MQFYTEKKNCPHLCCTCWISPKYLNVYWREGGGIFAISNVIDKSVGVLFIINHSGLFSTW